MSFESYVAHCGLSAELSALVQSTGFAEAVSTHQHALTSLLQSAESSDIAVQWQFKVPELGEGGACSLFGILADEPYDLTAILGGVTAQSQRLLAQATAVVQYYRQHSRSHWFGVYQARVNPQGERVLVKLAYFGAESRAEFPLTTEFAQISNNSSVGLSGHGRIINDVEGYVAKGGEYYTCDPKVQAEACLPVFDEQGNVAGIVDSEAFAKDFFSGDELALLLAVTTTLSSVLA